MVYKGKVLKTSWIFCELSQLLLRDRGPLRKCINPLFFPVLWILWFLLISQQYSTLQRTDSLQESHQCAKS